MADAVTTNVQVNGAKNYVATFTNISDATGENAVVKVDKSTLVNELGKEPAKLNIERVQWVMQGFTGVRILWDHTTDDVGLLLSGTMGDIKFSKEAPLQDPGSAGGTGDILFTTSGAASGATYTITLWLNKVGSV